MEKFNPKLFDSLKPSDREDVKKRFNILPDADAVNDEKKYDEQEIINMLYYDHKCIDIPESCLTKEISSSPEVQKAAARRLEMELVNNHNIDAALELRDKFNLAGDLAQEAAKYSIIWNLSNKYTPVDARIEEIYEIKKIFKLTDEMIKDAAIQGMAHRLSRDDLENVDKIKKIFKLTDEMIKDAAIQGIALRLSNHWKDEYIDKAIEIKNKYHLLDEDAQEAAKQGLILVLSGSGSYYCAIRIKEEFNLSDEAVNSPDVQEVLKQRIKSLLNKSNFDQAIEIKTKFKLSDEAIQDVLKQEMIFRLSRHDIESALKVKSLGLLNYTLLLPEVQKAVKEHISSKIYGDDVDESLKIKEKFSLPNEAFQDAIKKVITELLAIEGIEDSFKTTIKKVFKIKERFNLPNDALIEAAKQGIILNTARSARVSDIDKIKTISEAFGVPEKVSQEDVKKGVMLALDEDRIYDALDIIEEFNVKIAYSELSEKFPEVNKLINKLESCVGTHTDFRDAESFIQLVRFKDDQEAFLRQIKQDPFLLQALIENKQHGLKLLLKYQQFDITAKKNIGTLYGNKSAILKQQSNIDPGSAEFRVLMQKRLINFERNGEILDEIKHEGVDVDQWLNYKLERRFDLGKEDELSFSEQIQSPIKRIDQAINNYITHINTTLTECKDDLLNIYLESDKKPELTAKLEKMRSQLSLPEQSNGEAKTQGIQKGIASLEKQLAQLSSVDAWGKIRGEINKLQLASGDLSGLYASLLSAEDELIKLSADSRASIAQKDKIKQLEQKLKEKIVSFDKILTDFQVLLENILTESFGQDRANSIIQEIYMSSGENLNHYQADLSTIQSLFKDNVSSLEKTPMRIAIASRNPDMDLYLGNYAPCCICIESAYHGEESPIADYITDLGMHNIVVYDEKRQKPVAVAWCFIGKNDDDVEPTLIIDNIEANTDYSVKFKTQLEKELGEYIKQFAKAAKISKVIQGPLNNDLEVTELSLIDRKLGGANRANGYYLEAELDEEVLLNRDNERLIEEFENEEKNREYENERGAFLHSNRARRAFQKDQ